jgi:NitT/TauT family transport system permease protein
MKKYKAALLHIAVILCFLVFWQLSSDYSVKIKFLFGSPYLVLQAFLEKPSEWVINTAITGMEAITGFIFGVGIGSIVGFSLLYSKRVANFTKPYIIALGAIPVFALAPMLIIWFGVGYPMKIASALLATILVALSQAYEGGKNVEPDLIEWFKMYTNSKTSLFTKLILPSSINWVFASLKLNVGFALLGAFLGEFIASDSGLGHEILSAGGVYDFPRVFAATICIIFLAISLNTLVSLLENFRYQIIEFLTVPKILRNRKR